MIARYDHVLTNRMAWHSRQVKQNKANFEIWRTEVHAGAE